jgi:arginine-tRNA-protein transferase
MSAWARSVDAVDEFREILRAAPARMDRLWAEGWRHFGSHFFRSRETVRDGQPYRILPLRIEVARFKPSRIHRRLLADRRDLRVDFLPASVDAEREEMFRSHRMRFKDNIPDSLYDFLSFQPDRVPCPAVQCCIWAAGRLIAVGYLDLGKDATSAVYAMFDPAYASRSPGIRLILEEIRFTAESGRKYLYTGYCYDRPSFYDYKRRFAGVEYLDWDTMQYRPLSKRPVE